MTQQFFVFLSLVTLTFDRDIRTRAGFVYNAPNHQFHHPTSSRSEVIVRTNTLTNKQTPLKTSTLLRYATPVGNHPRRRQTCCSVWLWRRRQHL